MINGWRELDSGIAVSKFFFAIQLGGNIKYLAVIRDFMTRAEDTARRIDLYTDSPAEKREFSEWAQHAGKPLSPFLMAKLRQLRASEGQKRAAGLLRAVEGMKKRIADLESELAEAQAHRDQYKAALDREKVLAFPEGGGH